MRRPLCDCLEWKWKPQGKAIGTEWSFSQFTRESICFLPLPVQRWMCKYAHEPGRKLQSRVAFSSPSKRKHSAEAAFLLKHPNTGTWVPLGSTGRLCHPKRCCCWPGHATAPGAAHKLPCWGPRNLQMLQPTPMCQRRGEPLRDSREFRNGGLFSTESQNSCVTKQSSS